MPRWTLVTLVVLVMLAVLGAWHWFIWARLVRDPGWSPGVTRALTAAVIVLGLSMPLGLIGARLLPRVAAIPVAWLGYLWMGVGFILLVLLLLGEAAKLLALGGGKLWASLGPQDAPTLDDPGRRQLLARGAAVAAGALSGAAVVHGLRGALGEVEVSEVEAPVARLPTALAGLTVVQLTDIHVGPLVGRRFVEGVVEKANAARPDLVVLTGDLVDGSPKELLSQMESLASLRARYGVWFVTGNHEYYSGAPAWIAALRRLGIRTLDNETVPIGDGPGGASFDLVGVPDLTAGQRGFSFARPDVAGALAGRDSDRARILLAHQPKVIDAAVASGVSLQLSGHTHGGQIWPFGALVALDQPYVSGLHRRGDTHIYVSRGTGFWGPPLRVGAPAEVTKLVLTPA